MKKQVTLLLCAIFVLVALGSVWWIGSSSPQSDPPKSPFSTPQSGIHATAITKSQATSIKVSLPSDSYTITKSDVGYGISGYDTEFLSQKQLADCVATLSNISCEIVAENVSDKKQYGLDLPRATVAVANADGTATFEVGGLSVLGGTYLALQGDNTVYHLANTAFERVIEGATAFIDKAVTSPPNKAASTQGTRVLPQRAIFSGKQYKTPLVLQKSTMTEFEKEYSLYSYIITSHNNKEANKDTVLSTLAALFEITADGVAVYQPTAQQLAEYGFDFPYATVNFFWSDKDGSEAETIINVALDEQGQAYVTKNGVPIIYKISKESLPWLDMQYQEIVSRLALVPDISNVSELSIAGGGIEERYLLNTQGDNISITSRGKAIDSQRFKTLYEQIISLPGEQFATQKPSPSAKKILTITYTYADGKVDTVELVENTALLVYLSVNGNAEFLTNAKYPNIIIENARILTTSDSLKPLY